MKSLLLHLSPSGRQGHQCLGIKEETRGDYGAQEYAAYDMIHNILQNQMEQLSGGNSRRFHLNRFTV